MSGEHGKPFDPVRIWLDVVSGASGFCSEVSSCINLGKNLIIHIPYELCWRREMREKVKAELGGVFRTVEFIDFATEIFDSGLLEYLKENCTGDAKYTFRTGRTDLVSFVCENLKCGDYDVLWLKGIPDSKVQECIDFVKTYAGQEKNSGPRIIIEVRGLRLATTNLFDKVPELVWTDYVKPFDVFTFCNVEVSQKQLSDDWKEYLAQLCSRLCMDDAELCDDILTEDDKTLTELDIMQVLGDLATRFPDRGLKRDNALPIEAQHVLYLYRNGYEDIIKHRVWEAQLRVLFAPIEKERLAFVEKYSEALKSSLRKFKVKQFGKEMQEPSEVELGTICHLFEEKDERGNAKFSVGDVTDKRRIELLHKCRNELAHAKCCDNVSVKALFDGCKIVKR